MVKNTIIAFLCLIAAVLLWKLSTASGLAPAASPRDNSRDGASNRIARISPASGESGNATTRRDRSEKKPQPDKTPPSRRPETYLGGSGNVASILMHEMGLTMEQFIKVQSITSRHWAEMTARAAKEVVHDEAASQASEDGAPVYRIAAMPPEERTSMLASIRDEIRGVAGVAAAEAVTSSIARSDAFGRMGKYDVEFRFKPLRGVHTDLDGRRTEYVSDIDYNIECDFSDPAVGRKFRSRICDLDDIQEYFGGIFKR